MKLINCIDFWMSESVKGKEVKMWRDMLISASLLGEESKTGILAMGVWLCWIYTQNICYFLIMVKV